MPVPVVVGAAAMQRKALATAAAQKALEFMKTHRVVFRNNGETASAVDIAGMTAGQLIAGIDVVHRDDRTEMDHTNTNNMIEAAVDYGPSQVAIRSALLLSRFYPKDETPSTAGDIEQLPDYAKGAVNDVDSDGITENGYDDDATKAIKKLKKRKRTDRYYCSKEAHEWRYHIKSLEYSKVYTLFQLDYTGENNNGPYPTQGEWVDSKDYRKIVELYRRLQRLATGPRFQSLLAALGTTKASFIQTLKNETATLNKLTSLANSSEIVALQQN